jgi:predicted DNA binding CopG/RHH family protein
MKHTTAKTAAPTAMARMPTAEAANFDWSAARPVSFPNLQPSSQTISLRMPLWMLHKLKTRANQWGIPYQAHLKEIIADSLRD